MAALTKGRHTAERAGRTFSHPLAAGARVWTGGIGVLEAGYLKPGRTAVGLKAVGIIEQDVDNTAGANADALCDVRRGVFRMANDAGDPVGRSHIGSNAYIVDDQTVAATDGAGTRSIAGTIVDIDDLGVWIEF